MALSDFIEEVRANIKRTSSGVSDARVTRFINWGQQYLADLHTYEEMRIRDTSSLTTTASDNSLSWPTRMKDLYSLTAQDGARSQKLVYVKARNYDTIIPRAAIYSENIPNWYVDFGSTFELFPIPDAVYTINARYSRYPADLSGSSDESALTRKDALLTAMATTFGFWALRELEDAAYWGGELVSPLFDASLTGDHSGEDWVPIARGFGDTGAVSLSGQWWTNPFTGRSVPGY